MSNFEMKSQALSRVATVKKSLRPTLTERAAWGAALALLVIHIALAWLGRPPGIETGHDDAQYLLLARSIRGLGYHEIYRIDAPFHTMYPPGYPLILALWGMLVGERFDSLVALNIMTSAATLGLVFVVVKRLWSSTVALLCLAILCVNPYLIENAGTIMSEPAYTFLSVLALSFLGLEGRDTRRDVIVAVLAIGAALTRSAGVTLLIAVGLHWFWERRFLALGVYTIVLTASVGLWLVTTAMAGEQFIGRSYVADAFKFRSTWDGQSFAGILLRRAVDHIPKYLALETPNRLSVPTVSGMVVDNVFGMLVIGVGLAIGFIVVFRRWRSLALYLLCYGSLLALWPWTVSRFVDPLIPLLVPTLVLGIMASAHYLKPDWELPAALTLTIILVVSGAVTTAGLVKDRIACGRGGPLLPLNCLLPEQASFFKALEYIKDHLSSDATIVTGKPATLYYYTGRRTVSREQVAFQDSASFVRFLRQTGTSYVLLSHIHSGEGRISELLEANCAVFALEGAFPPSAYLFRLLDEGAATYEVSSCEAIANYRQATSGRNLKIVH
jgi:4-amino-4-deoxy-L-arabinose transferase-like glycosyltransferase